MRCPENTCRAVANHHECVRCGLPILPPSPSADEIARFFSRLREYVAAAEGQAGPAFDAWEREALVRLRRGELEYGPRNFLADGVDPEREAREEAADGPNWVLGAMARNPERWNSPALWSAAYRFYQAYRDLLVALHEET